MLVKCIKCHKTKKHYAKGMCVSCYHWNYLKTHPGAYEKHKKCVYKWKDKHPLKCARSSLKHHLKKLGKNRRSIVEDIIKEIEDSYE